MPSAPVLIITAPPSQLHNNFNEELGRGKYKDPGSPCRLKKLASEVPGRKVAERWETVTEIASRKKDKH